MTTLKQARQEYGLDVLYPEEVDDIEVQRHEALLVPAVVVPAQSYQTPTGGWGWAWLRRYMRSDLRVEPITPLGDGERAADFYSCRDVDHLRHDTVNAAVEDELDTLGITLWPDELLVMGYVDSDDDLVHPEPGTVYVVRDEDCDVVVNVAAWIREHMAHWLEEPEVAAWVAASEKAVWGAVP